MMRVADLALPPAIAAFLFLTAVAAGPVVAVGAVLGLWFLALVYRWPILGLTLMILAGTALQVLGSEHIIRMPISLGKAAGAATLLCWLAHTILLRERMTWSPQIAALGAFCGAVALGQFVAPDAGEAREGLFRHAQLFLLFLMIASIAGRSARLLDQALIALTASLSLAAVIGLLEFLLPSLAIEYDDPSLVQGGIGAIVDADSLEGVQIKRITGGMGDSNWFAYTLVCCLPINLYLLHRYRGALPRLLILAAGGLQATGIVLSYTRSAMIACAVVVLVLALRRRISLRLILAGALLGGALFAVWSPAGLERVFSVQYAREGSTPFRTWLLRGGVALIAERPVTGYGYNQYGPNFLHWIGQQPGVDESVQVWVAEFERRVRAGEERPEWIMPHNTGIQLWVEFGLAGVLAFGAFLLFLLRDLRIVSRVGSPGQRLLADCLLAGLLGFVVCAAFGHLLLLKVSWMLGGLGAALLRVAVEDAGGAAS